MSALKTQRRQLALMTNPALDLARGCYLACCEFFKAMPGVCGAQLAVCHTARLITTTWASSSLIATCPSPRGARECKDWPEEHSAPSSSVILGAEWQGVPAAVYILALEIKKPHQPINQPTTGSMSGHPVLTTTSMLPMSALTR